MPRLNSSARPQVGQAMIASETGADNAQYWFCEGSGDTTWRNCPSRHSFLSRVLQARWLAGLY